VRGRSANAGSDQGRRPGKYRPTGCLEAGAQSSFRRFDFGVGSGWGLGSITRSGAGTRGFQAGSVASAAPAEQVSAAHGSASGSGDKGVDGTLYGLGAPGSVRTTSPASHASGLSARGRSHGGAGQASGTGDHGGGETGIAAGSRSGQGPTGSTRHRGDDSGRVRPDIALRYCTAADGLRRHGSQRRLQWQAKATRTHHQDRQRTSEKHRRRSRMELSAPACDRAKVAQATT